MDDADQDIDAERARAIDAAADADLHTENLSTALLDYALLRLVSDTASKPIVDGGLQGASPGSPRRRSRGSWLDQRSA